MRGCATGEIWISLKRGEEKREEGERKKSANFFSYIIAPG